jgi:catechol 2,3-dioxygenase-like lactoylglutathione lyase family enzyme
MMEQLIARLLDRFEAGALSRRQFVQSMTSVAAAFAAGQGSAPPSGFRAVALDHLSYQVQDYRVTRDFYADLLGMRVSNDDGRQCYLHFDERSRLIARNHRGQPSSDGSRPQPVIDHVSYWLADWNTDVVEAALRRRGLTPRLDLADGHGYVSFNVRDPDGFTLQLAGMARPGDRYYDAPGR